MASREPPLDQITWRNDMFLQTRGGLHSNSVLYYIQDSPFFEWTSNNGVVFKQHEAAQRYDVLGMREAFEGILDTMSGLEYRVLQAPEIMAYGFGTGVWVISKQMRKVHHNGEVEITPLATYFIINENMFTAPSIGDVLKSRLLTVLSSMNKFISTAEDLPEFSPSRGSTYPKPKVSNRKAIESQFSKENTPMPDEDNAQKKVSLSSANSHLSNVLLNESLKISNKYDDQYMDEWPIKGEPGNFHMATKSQVEPNMLMVPPTVNKGLLGNSGKAISMPTPLKTDIAPAKKDSKSGKSPKTPGTGGGAPKPKRRKSKAPGSVSPTS